MGKAEHRVIELDGEVAMMGKTIRSKDDTISALTEEVAN